MAMINEFGEVIAQGKIRLKIGVTAGNIFNPSARAYSDLKSML